MSYRATEELVLGNQADSSSNRMLHLRPKHPTVKKFWLHLFPQTTLHSGEVE